MLILNDFVTISRKKKNLNGKRKSEFWVPDPSLTFGGRVNRKCRQRTLGTETNHVDDATTRGHQMRLKNFAHGPATNDIYVKLLFYHFSGKKYRRFANCDKKKLNKFCEITQARYLL